MEKDTWMEKVITYHWKQGTAADPVSSAEGSSQHGTAQLYCRTSSSHAMNLKSTNPPCTERGAEPTCQPLPPPDPCLEPQALQHMDGSSQG